MYDNNLTLISRDAAEIAGLKFYFTGRPCKRGHVDLRFVTSGACKRCVYRNSGKVPQGRNVMVVHHVFTEAPTIEERQELQKILVAWSDHALVAARKVLADRSASVAALEADLKANATQRS